jgi:cbb3-type cytochrome oxidase subunit 1
MALGRIQPTCLQGQKLAWGMTKEGNTNYGIVFHIHRAMVMPENGDKSYSVPVDDYTFSLAGFRAAMLAKFNASKVHLTYTKIPQHAIEDPQTN